MSDTQYGCRIIYRPDNVYLIGDVHNHADNLIEVIDQLETRLKPGDHVVFCGDLVDRGHQPSLTITALIDFVRRYPDQVFFVEGNHDYMLRSYLLTGDKMWMQYLEPTLRMLQYDWTLPDIQPDTIAAALMSRGFQEIVSRTIPYYETDTLIATHAPLDITMAYVNGGITYPQDYANRTSNAAFTHLLERLDVKWQFTDENSKLPMIDKFMVCGHQFVGKSPKIFKDRAFIDTGCGLKPFGKLTCLVYPGKQFFQST